MDAVDAVVRELGRYQPPLGVDLYMLVVSIARRYEKHGRYRHDLGGGEARAAIATQARNRLARQFRDQLRDEESRRLLMEEFYDRVAKRTARAGVFPALAEIPPEDLVLYFLFTFAHLGVNQAMVATGRSKAVCDDIYDRCRPERKSASLGRNEGV